MPVFSTEGPIDDQWTRIGADRDVPAGIAAVLDWDRAVAGNAQALAGRDPRGVIIAADFDVARLLPLLGRLGLIVVASGTFKDGRIFSAGRLLRHRYGFNGDLRAQGNILPDQISFLARCGFSSFDVAADFDVTAALQVSRAYPFRYQSGPGERSNIAARRQAAPALAATGA